MQRLRRITQAQWAGAGGVIVTLMANFAWDSWRAANQATNTAPLWPVFVFGGIGIGGLYMTVAAILRLPPLQALLSPEGRDFSVELTEAPQTGFFAEQEAVVFPDVWVINHRPERSTILEFRVTFDWTDGNGTQHRCELESGPTFRVFRRDADLHVIDFLPNPIDLPANRKRDLPFLLPNRPLPDQLFKHFTLYVMEVQTGVENQLTEVGKRYRFRCEPEPESDSS